MYPKPSHLHPLLPTSFILDTNGTLSYSRSQGERPRDAVDISKASIGRSRKRRHLVIDTGDKVPWHCKALNEQDYERWVETGADVVVG